MRKRIEELNKRYEDLKDETNLEKASGSLSKLANLRSEFDETFDQYFDDVELRKKYNDYDEENEEILFYKSNNDLLNELDSVDLEAYIKFYENCIAELEEELENLK